MAPEVIGRCQRCGKPLAFLPEKGLVSADGSTCCLGYPDGHLVRMSLGVPVPPVLIDRIGAWAVEQHERQRNRAIADAHQRELQEHRGHQAVMGQWHDGTCTGCGTEDSLIGVPGSDLCRYCEELRILTPPQPAAPAPAEPVPYPRIRLLLSSLLLTVLSLVLIFTGAPALISATLLTLAFLLARKA